MAFTPFVMAAKVKLGDRVFAKATVFDSQESSRWSKEVCGENLDKEVCRGIVEGLKKLGTVAQVMWDIDQSVSETPTSLLSRNHKNSGPGVLPRGDLEEGSKEEKDYSSLGKESLSSEDEDESYHQLVRWEDACSIARGYTTEKNGLTWTFLRADIIDDPNRHAKYWPRLHAERVQELSMFSWIGKGDCSGGMPMLSRF